MIPHNKIKQAICDLTRVADTNLGTEVTLPVIYPGGDLATVTISYSLASGDALVHDASGGVMHLNSLNVKLSDAAFHKFKEYAARYGCEFEGGRVLRHCKADQVAAAAALVANASKAIADQSLEVRRKMDSDFREAVAETVRKVAGARVRDHESLLGKSGREYYVHHVILDHRAQEPVAFVEPFPNRTAIAPHFVEFSDLRGSYADVEGIAIYDENADFRPVDLVLLTEVCKVTPLARSASELSRIANR